jgi:hypothetical protein
MGRHATSRARGIPRVRVSCVVTGAYTHARAVHNAERANAGVGTALRKMAVLRLASGKGPDTLVVKRPRTSDDDVPFSPRPPSPQTSPLPSPTMSTPPSGQRSAVVTGAAQGIGAAVAARLAQDGLSVLLVDLPAKQAALDALAEQIVAAGGRAATFAGDVSVEEDVKGMVSHAVGELGPLGVVRESVSALGRC